jgi:hypothetical protein
MACGENFIVYQKSGEDELAIQIKRSIDGS